MKLKKEKDKEILYKRGEIVQLVPKKVKNPTLSGCFLVISEVIDWGVIGYIPIPGRSGLPPEVAWYRAHWEEIKKTSGIAPYVVWVEG